MSFNKCILVGRLTRDPEMKYSSSGTGIASFSMAVDRKYQPDKKNKLTDFFDIFCFGKLAETVAEYLMKGKLILVEGELQQQRWESDGEKRSKIKVLMNNFSFLESKKTEDDTRSNFEKTRDEIQEKMNEPVDDENDSDDDLVPF